MMRNDGPSSILHILVGVGETNGQYNEHCLPLRRERRISICSLTRTSITPPDEIKLYEGDGTIRGCIRVLRTALSRDDYDVIHAHAPVSGAALFAVNLLRGRSMSRCAFTMQNSFPNCRLRNKVLLFLVFATFPAVIVCSESVRRSLPYVLRVLGGRRISVVTNGVDLGRIDRVLNGSEAIPGESGEYRVVSVGRLIEIKNPSTLLRAFDKACGPESRLAFVGEGHLRSQLTAEADAMGSAARVTFTGLVDRDEVYRHVARADLFVSTSYGEGMPVAVLEAMACGCPVVLSDIPPHREIAGETDFIPLVNPDDVAGFAREVRRFHDMTPAERAVIGRRCRQLVEDRFSIAAMHRTLSNVYARIGGQAKAMEGAVR
jgi:glycosyltransferase involved in cell wall biosynthesis